MPAEQPERTGGKGRMILLTSGTTGSPKGAKQSGGRRRQSRNPQGDPGPHAVARRGDHRDRRADVPRMGLFTVDLRRVDGLHGGHAAQVRPGGHPGSHRPPPGDGPCRGSGDVRPHHGAARRGCETATAARSLRFAAASGSRMRPDVVIAFMDQFGDVIYNNYNATEAGMIATATHRPGPARRPRTPRRPARGWNRNPDPGPGIQ